MAKYAPGSRVIYYPDKGEAKFATYIEAMTGIRSQIHVDGDDPEEMTEVRTDHLAHGIDDPELKGPPQPAPAAGNQHAYNFLYQLNVAEQRNPDYFGQQLQQINNEPARQWQHGAYNDFGDRRWDNVYQIWRTLADWALIYGQLPALPLANVPPPQPVYEPEPPNHAYRDDGGIERWYCADCGEWFEYEDWCEQHDVEEVPEDGPYWEPPDPADIAPDPVEEGPF